MSDNSIAGKIIKQFRNLVDKQTSITNQNQTEWNFDLCGLDDNQLKYLTMHVADLLYLYYILLQNHPTNTIFQRLFQLYYIFINTSLEMIDLKSLNFDAEISKEIMFAFNIQINRENYMKLINHQIEVVTSNDQQYLSNFITYSPIKAVDFIEFDFPNNNMTVLLSNLRQQSDQFLQPYINSMVLLLQESISQFGNISCTFMIRYCIFMIITLFSLSCCKQYSFDLLKQQKSVFDYYFNMVTNYDALLSECFKLTNIQQYIDNPDVSQFLIQRYYQYLQVDDSTKTKLKVSQFTRDQDNYIKAMFIFNYPPKVIDKLRIFNDKYQTNLEVARLSQRYHRTLQKNQNHGKWTPKEEQKLTELFNKFDSNFIMIACQLKDRTQYQVKQHLKTMGFI